jgi:biopolymer transport protein TolR
MGMQINGNGSKGQLVSEINVTPLVDVMLVLLIIFMVTAPMMTQGIDVKLPESSAPTIPSEDERLVVTVTKDQQIYLNEYQVALDDLGTKLSAIYQEQQNKKGVFLRADDSIPYGYVVKVMGVMREAGIDQIGMVTEPLQSPPPTKNKKK